MATDINHVILVGRVTRDVGSDERSFGYVGNGQARANVSIAVNRSRKGADGNWTEEANFFDVTIWGKQAENLKPYLTKGKQICVDGYLKQDRWEKDGQKFNKVNIVANNVQLLGGKSDGNGGQSSQNSSSFKPAITTSQNTQSFDNDSYPSDGGDFPEDIPF